MTSDLERSAGRFRELSDTMRAFAQAATDYQRLLDVIAERLARLIGDGCMLLLLSEDQTELVTGAIHFTDPAVMAVARRALATRPIRVDGPTLGSRLIRSRAALLVPDVDLARLAAELTPDWAEALAAIGVRSLLAVPLESDGRLLGLISLQRVVPGGPAFDAEDELLARSLGEHAALALSNARLLQSLQRELGERRRAEEQAKRFVALIQHSGEFIAMASLDGQVLFINDHGRRLVGLAPDLDLSRIRLSDFHTDEGMKRAAVLREHGRWQGQGKLRNLQTGEWIDTQVSSFLVRDERGEPFGFATVQHDMRETRRLEAQLQQAQKMEALGTLAGGIAHDFNNILGAIVGNVELARLDLEPEHGARRHLDEIAKAGRRAKGLIAQILAFTRQQQTAKHVIRLADVVGEALSLLRSTMPSTVELATHLAPSTPNVVADATQLQQILLNLCTNAWQAFDGRPGHIEIGLEAVLVDVGQRSARLWVRDDGPGMDAATLGRIFDPFFTTKPPGVGTGLGLSVVHGIVKDHGGAIQVTSAPGEGAMFALLFPGVDDEVAPHAAEVAELPRGRGQRILFIDDEEPLVTLARDLLGRMGYQVTGFSDVADALRAVRADPHGFDLVLTDHNMPGMSGLAVAEELAALRPDLPVILASGFISDELRAGAARAGVRHVLYKPNTVDEMILAVHRLLTGESA